MFSPSIIFYCTTLILFQGHQSEARGPVCLQCDQVAQPSDCRNVKQCPDQELCIMRKYVTNGGHTWFDVGCSSSQRCSPITSILGKRDDDDAEAEAMSIVSSKLRRNAELNITSTYVRSAGTTIVCEKCCFGDICNAGSLCGTVGFLHEMVCYDCSSTNEDGCTTIRLCGQDEKCFIDKVNRNSTSNSVWNTGCRHKTVCQQLQSNPGSDCLSSCCSSDLCNIQCTSNNTDAMCADMTPTCTNKTFQSFVCSETKLQTVCQRSCGLCHCNPNPCKHGTCTSSRQGYTCNCDAGYMGPICDKDMNPCKSGPCMHGTCNNGPNEYNCTCDIGFTGSTCDTVISTPPGTLWKWGDCGGDPATSSIFFSHVDIFPKPIQIPGNITTAYDITINRRIGEHSNFSVGLTIERKMPNNSWVDVPCNKNCAGSCFYENLCEKFAGCCSDPNCSQIVLHSGLKCPFCPIDPVHLVMNYHRHGKRSFLESVTAFFEALGKGFSILSTMMSWLQLLSGRLELLTLNENNATSAWDFMWNGDFRIQVDFIELDELIGCFGAEMSIRN